MLCRVLQNVRLLGPGMRLKTDTILNPQGIFKINHPPFPNDEKFERVEYRTEYLIPKVPKGKPQVPFPKVNPYYFYIASGQKQPSQEHTRYFALEKDGKIYHLFHASRYVYGRMASRIATILQGKLYPLNYRGAVNHNHYVIVVNSEQLYLTGDKLNEKIFFWHTGYPGGLKQRRMKDLMKEKPEKLLTRTVKKMLPKNKRNVDMLARLYIFRGLYHNFDLPQFAPQLPPDPNKDLGFDAITKDSKIIFKSSEIIPEEIKSLNLKEEIDPYIGKLPLYYREPVLTRGKKAHYHAFLEAKWDRKQRRRAQSSHKLEV